MDIFYDTNEDYNNMNNILYKQILLNQVSYNTNKKDSIPNIQEKLNNISNNINKDDSHEINHKDEALIGNLIPSIILLSENKININEEFNKDGDTLLHLACSFSNLNAIRLLIEKYNADINLKNKNGQTPFYKLCDNRKSDNEIIAYFLQKKDLIINDVDSNGINPLLLSIKNKNINLFYTLTSMGCDLNHKDKEFHDVYYYALKYDNLPVLKYLLKYSQIDLYSSCNNLTPILVTSEGSNCCKYLFKYHYKKAIFGITQPLNKDNHQQNELNLFNYELISTCYNQNSSNFILAFFKIIIANTKYYFKAYNIKFLFLYLIIKRLFGNSALRKISLVYYCGIIFLFTYFYIDLRQFNIKIYDIISLITSIAGAVLCYNLFIKNLPEKNQNFYEKVFNSAYDKKSDNILGICENAYKNNIFELPGCGEDCPRCLIRKKRNVQHCNRCDCCVKDFYFHSNLLGICINRDNALNYSLLNIIFAFKEFAFIGLLYNILVENDKYSWGFSFYKFMVVLFRGNLLLKIFSIILFFNGYICLGIGLSVLICIGYNVSYYLTYRTHKIPNGRLVQRKIFGIFIDYLAPIVNMIGVPQFCQNLIKRKNNIEFV